MADLQEKAVSMPLLSVFGHSWVDSTGVEEPDAFMAARIAQHFGLELRNRGIGGSLSAETVQLLETDPAEPSSIYLLITGLNDVRMFGPCEQALENYSKTLNRLFAMFHETNGASPVVAVEQPRLLDYSLHAPFNRGSDATVDAYNAALVEAAAAWPHVIVARASRWDALTMLQSDTVHPNYLGHACLADAVISRIEATEIRRNAE